MSAVSNSFLKRASNAAHEAYLSLADCEQHMRREATPEQYRVWVELLNYYREGHVGMQEFVEVMEKK